MSIKSIVLDAVSNKLLLRRGSGQAPLSMPNLDGQSFRAKNFLINGAMDFFQRSTSLVNTVIDSQQHLNADRWLTWHNSAGITAGQSGRDSTALGRSSKYNIRLVGTAAAAAQGMHIAQRIESARGRELFAAGSMSLSFLVQSTAIRDLTLSLKYPSAEDTFGGTSGTGQTTYHTSAVVQIPFNSSTTLVKFENLPVHTNIIRGLQVELLCNQFQTLASPQSIYFSEMMLNAGSKAAPFVRAGDSLEAELLMCQRFYEKSYDVDTTPNSNVNAGAYTVCDLLASASTTIGMKIPFKVRKRATPTMAFYNRATGVSSWDSDRSNGGSIISDANVTVAAFQTGESGFGVNVTGSLAGTTGDPIRLQGHWTAEIEL